jgi:hypothetical protein
MFIIPAIVLKGCAIALATPVATFAIDVPAPFATPKALDVPLFGFSTTFEVAQLSAAWKNHPSSPSRSIFVIGLFEAY